MDKRPHALVTGASSGIGAAIVERLLRDGWRVTEISRRPGPFDHPAFDHLSLDLSEVETIANAVDGIAPTALVHAAGILKVGELGSLDHDGGTVFIGSRTASGAAGRGQYAATKAALVALARSWAIELAPRGVTVNVVAPAATETPMLKDPTRANIMPKLPPIGRFIRPDEVASAVAFLLSTDAAAITGQQLIICGGSSL